VLVLLSVFASKVSNRLGVPALLLFLIVGMLAGSDGIGKIAFDDPWSAQLLGVVALALILFAGGLDTQWNDIKPVVRQGILLSTIGVLLTTVIVGGLVYLLLDFTLLEGLLLGAIVSSTDAAAVFSVLGSRNMSLKSNLGPLLELESGSNDPMAVFLTIGLTELISDSSLSAISLIPLFVRQMVLGAVLGYGIGRGAVVIFNRLGLNNDGLYPVLSIALVLFTYGVTASLGGSGFLAVYLVGIIMGNSAFVHKMSLKHFHDGIAWLMQIAMFLTLGLLVFPSKLVPVMGRGLLVSVILIFIARPVGVFASLFFTRIGFREKVMISWVGLRGATPIILATFPLLEGIPQADLIFNLVFFIVLTSVLLQGTTLALVARWLGVAVPHQTPTEFPIDFVPVENIQSELVELIVPSNSPAVRRQLVDLHIPDGALIVLLSRNNEFLVPNGSTRLQPDDRLLVLGDEPALSHMRMVIGEQA
jgi:cell volume regulation protein A